MELFQIWLNLPAARKFATPHFTMLWNADIPRVAHVDEAGRKTEITVVAGSFEGRRAPSPPPESWASVEDTDVAIWCLTLEPGATVTLPAARPGTIRTLFFFAGDSLRVGGQSLQPQRAARVAVDVPLVLEGGRQTVEVLVLQGRPIGEPVVQYGPFVMNTRAEIAEAYRAYQETQFGGWPWPVDDPVHLATHRCGTRFRHGVASTIVDLRRG